MFTLLDLSVAFDIAGHQMLMFHIQESAGLTQTHWNGLGSSFHTKDRRWISNCSSICAVLQCTVLFPVSLNSYTILLGELVRQYRFKCLQYADLAHFYIFYIKNKQQYHLPLITMPTWKQNLDEQLAKTEPKEDWAKPGENREEVSAVKSFLLMWYPLRSWDTMW